MTLLTALLALLALAPGCLVARGDEAATGSWSDFLGPQRASRSPLAEIRTNWPLPILWHSEIGTSYTAPTIAGDRCFEYGRYGDADQLTCRHADTGRVIWQQSDATRYDDMLDYNNGPRATPVVAHECVYTMSAEGLLTCRATGDGHLIWQVPTSERFGVVKNFFGVGSTPVVAGDLLIANIGGSPAGEPRDVYVAGGRVKPNGTGVVAFDCRTGEVRWKATNELASYASPVVATIDDVAMVLVFARGGLVAVELATGRELFDYPWRAALLESVNASTPVVVGSRVFISETYERGSVLLDVAKQAAGDWKADVVWSDTDKRRDKSLELHWNTAVYHDGHLYGSSGRHSGAAELRCVEFATGRVQWTKRGLGRCSLTYVGDHLVCLGEDGRVRLLAATPDRYDEVATMDPVDEAGQLLLNPDAWVAPVIARGKLYLRGSDRMVCFQLAPASE